MSAGGFLARHVLALGVLVALPCLLWTAAYVALILCAMVVNGDPGGLLLYPAGLVMVFTAALGFGFAVCFPITAITEWVGHRRRWPRVVQFSLGVMLLMLPPVVTGFLAAVQREAPWHTFPAVVAIGFAVIVAPFTVYWGIAQSVPVSWAVFRWIRGLFKGKDGEPPFPDYPRRPSEDGTRSFRALR